MTIEEYCNGVATMTHPADNGTRAVCALATGTEPSDMPDWMRAALPQGLDQDAARERVSEWIAESAIAD